MSRFEWFLGTVLFVGLLAATTVAVSLPGHGLAERLVLLYITALAAFSLGREVGASRRQ